MNDNSKPTALTGWPWDDGKTFDQWFDAEGWDEQHRAMFALVWNAALDNAALDIDDEQHYWLERLKG